MKASTAGLPSWPISVGSTISLFLSPWVGAEPSARTATTGTSSRAAASAASAACSLPCPRLVRGEGLRHARIGRAVVIAELLPARVQVPGHVHDPTPRAALAGHQARCDNVD